MMGSAHINGSVIIPVLIATVMRGHTVGHDHGVSAFDGFIGDGFGEVDG